MAKEKWIQKALPKSSKGKLHKELKVPQGEKIPTAKLKAAEKKGGIGAKRSHLAQTLKKLHK